MTGTNRLLNIGSKKRTHLSRTATHIAASRGMMDTLTTAILANCVGIHGSRIMVRHAGHRHRFRGMTFNLNAGERRFNGYQRHHQHQRPIQKGIAHSADLLSLGWIHSREPYYNPALWP